LTEGYARDSSAREAAACICLIYKNQLSDPKRAKEWCGKYSGSFNHVLPDNDPMKSLIQSLEMEDSKTKDVGDG
jgi:hypothetical protein